MLEEEKQALTELQTSNEKEKSQLSKEMLHKEKERENIKKEYQEALMKLQVNDL